MPLEGRSEFAQQRDIFNFAKTSKGKPQVEAWRFMSSRPDNAVAMRPLGVFRIMIRHLQIKSDGNVHDREGAAGMARSCRAERNQIITTHQVGRFGQLLNRIITNNFCGYGIAKRHDVLLKALVNAVRAAAKADSLQHNNVFPGAHLLQYLWPHSDADLAEVSFAQQQHQGARLPDSASNGERNFIRENCPVIRQL